MAGPIKIFLKPVTQYHSVSKASYSNLAERWNVHFGYPNLDAKEYENYYYLGGISQKSMGDLIGTSYIASCENQKDREEVFKKPVEYQLVWKHVFINDFGGPSWDSSMWRPIGPPGYIALGLVGQKGGVNPMNANINFFEKFRCVKSEYLVQTGMGEKIWNFPEAMIGNPQPISAWQVNNKDGVAMNCFVAHGDQGKPSFGAHWFNPINIVLL